MDFNQYKIERLKDEKFKKAYDALAPEYEIKSQLIKARIENDYTQEKLAEIIGTSQSRLSKLEKGTLNPSLNFLKKVADGLGYNLHITFEKKSS